MSLNFASAAKNPGLAGTFFYSAMFKHHSIDARYEALRISDMLALEKLIAEKHYAGISISMPYKGAVLKLLTHQTLNVTGNNSCNSVLIEGSSVKGENTDIFGVAKSLTAIEPEWTVNLLGDGMIASQYVRELERMGANFLQFSRKLGNWNLRNSNKPKVVINATALGTINSSSAVDSVEGCSFVVDLSIRHGALRNLCIESGVQYFSGLDFYKEVFRHQFRFYTGINPDMELFDELLDSYKSSL